MLFSNRDLKKLLVPLLIEQTLVVTIGMMDTVMVASVGESAVSGVSLVDSINILLLAVFNALATGGSVVTSQYLGKKDLGKASSSAKQLFNVAILVSFVLMILFLILRRPLLSGIFGSIEQSVMDNAMIYCLLSALSYPFISVYSAAAALLRAQGNTKATLHTSLLMNIINLGGNAFLIIGLGWGTMGAGLATLVSRAVGAIVATAQLYSDGCRLPAPNLLKLEWDSELVGKILSIGVPNGFEGSFFQLGKLVLVRMISTFGTASIAANAVGNTMGTIQCLPGNAISLAMITVIGQCVGAKEYGQARHYVKKLMLLTYSCMGVLNLLMLMATPVITKPFNLSPEADELARWIVAIHGVGAMFIWPMSFVFPNALRAAGDAKFTMIVSSISMVAFRVVFGILLGQTFGFGVIGVWIAMQIDWVFRITCFILRYRSGKWETKALV